MKEYLDKKINQALHKDEDLDTTLKVLIGTAYIALQGVCFDKDIFLDECIALAYEKMEGDGNDDDN